MTRPVRYLYSALIHLIRPIAFALVLWRGLRNRRYWVGLGERFGYGPAVHAPSLWVHAVSLGEVSAAAPLIRALQARHPQVPVVLTTGTPTGRDRAQAMFGGSLDVRYLPYDTPGAMRRLMGRLGPRVVIIMETELWPNLFAQSRRRGVPTVLASARLTLKSVARYRRCGGLFREVLSGDVLVAAQSADDVERFVAIGADRGRTRAIGNVKFDVRVDDVAAKRGRETRSAQWGARPVWIAGSTHAGEEEPVLDAHAELRRVAQGALLLLVPRHPERFPAVAELLTRRGVRFERRSDRRGHGQTVRSDTTVLLVDTVGELAALYAAVDVAFVGGSLVPVGGHNLLEPATMGVPVMIGPYQANGREIADLLIREGAAFEVSGAAQLSATLGNLLADPARRQRAGAAGRRVVEANRGSVARLLGVIDPLLAAAPPPHPRISGSLKFP